MGGEFLILLDTHALVWLDFDDPALGPRATGLADAALQTGGLAVSAMTFWELAMLIKCRRLDLEDPLETWRREFIAGGLVELPLNGEIAMLSVNLDDFHADPADRIIVATAQHHRATLLTADQRILSWPGLVDRQDARQ